MPPARTLRVTLDAANLDEVRAALSASSSLVLAVNALEDLIPGKANPIVLDRRPLDDLMRCRDAYVATIGELQAVEPEPSK